MIELRWLIDKHSDARVLQYREEAMPWYLRNPTDNRPEPEWKDVLEHIATHSTVAKE